jgi:hypothetical protein
VSAALGEGSTMVEETWFSRDLPVLEAAVRAFDALAPRMIPEGKEIAEATGFGMQDVAKALIALDGEYLDVAKTAGDAAGWCIKRVRGNARRAIGAWPEPVRLAEQVIAAIDVAAEKALDGRFKPTREVVTTALAEVLARQLGA